MNSTTTLAQTVPRDWFPPALDQYGDVAGDTVAFVVAFGVVYFVGRLLVLPSVVRVVRARNPNNRTLVTATETYLRVAVAGLAVLVGLAVAGQIDSLLGTDSAILVAALTFVLGVAGQEVFGSLISGLFLVADPDFNVGDWIAWPGGEGVVEDVDFRVTRIRTRDNETVAVPNTELTTNALTSPFGRDRYRVVEEAYVPYDEDTERALRELQQVATAVEGTLDDPEPRARIDSLGPDAVTLRAEFWVEHPDRSTVDDVRSAYRRRVKRRFAEADLTLAPPAGRELSGSLSVDSLAAPTETDDD